MDVRLLPLRQPWRWRHSREAHLAMVVVLLALAMLVVLLALAMVVKMSPVPRSISPHCRCRRSGRRRGMLGTLTRWVGGSSV